MIITVRLILDNFSRSFHIVMALNTIAVSETSISLSPEMASPSPWISNRPFKHNITNKQLFLIFFSSTLTQFSKLYHHTHLVILDSFSHAFYI